MKRQQLISAGGVVFRIVSNEPVYLLLGFRRRPTWCLPKGIIEEGETEIEAAQREVIEETGINDLNLINDIGTIHYSFWFRGKNFDKTVYFYLFETKQIKAKVGSEHDIYGWFTFERARDTLSYRNEKSILEKANSIILSIIQK